MQGQLPARSGSGEALLHGADGRLPVVSAHGGRDKGSVWFSNKRMPMPFMRPSLSCPGLLSKTPPPNTIALGVRISTYELGGPRHSDHSKND